MFMYIKFILSCIIFYPLSIHADTSLCHETTFDDSKDISLGSGPISMNSLSNGTHVCIRVSYNLKKPISYVPNWISIGISRSNYMVSSPASNMILYQPSNADTPSVYVINGYTTTSTVLSTNSNGKNSYSFYKSNSTNGILQFTFQRTIQAMTSSDVAIQPSGKNYVIWAYDKSWPISGHSKGAKGSASLNLALTNSTVAGSDQFTSTTSDLKVQSTISIIIAIIGFLIMCLMGFIITKLFEKSSFSSFFIQKRIWKPLQHSKIYKNIDGLTLNFFSTFLSLKYGEIIIICIFIGTLLTIFFVIKDKSISNLNGADNSKIMGLVTGHLASTFLMYTFLPIHKSFIWEFYFGNSFERILKYHRILGRFVILSIFIHLLFVLDKLDIISMEEYGTQKVIPLFGFLSFISFIIMGLFSLDYIRRRFYKLFYYSHLLFMLIGIIFSILHSTIVMYMMIFPLVLYIIGLLYYRFTSYFCGPKYYISEFPKFYTDAIFIEIIPNSKTKKLLNKIQPGSYFWIKIPGISYFESHPYSVIVSQKDKTFGFCLKLTSSNGNKNTFSKKLSSYLVSKKHLKNGTIYLDGPHGNTSVNIYNYKKIFMIAGGIGITPLLNIRNLLLNYKNNNKDKKDKKDTIPEIIVLIWVVRTPEQLLNCESYMFLPPKNKKNSNKNIEYDNMDITTRLYVSKYRHNDPKSIKSPDTGITMVYNLGRPDIKDLLNNKYDQNPMEINNISPSTNKLNKMITKTAVLVCGPMDLCDEVERVSFDYKYDFHREEFRL